VASLSQGRTAAAQCGLFTYKSVPVIFEPPCNMKQEPQYSLRVPLGTHRTSTVQSTVTSHRVVTDVSKDRSGFMFRVKQSEQNDCLAMQQHRWDNLTSLISYPPYTMHAVCK